MPVLGIELTWDLGSVVVDLGDPTVKLGLAIVPFVILVRDLRPESKSQKIPASRPVAVHTTLQGKKRSPNVSRGWPSLPKFLRHLRRRCSDFTGKHAEAGRTAATPSHQPSPSNWRSTAAHAALRSPSKSLSERKDAFARAERTMCTHSAVATPTPSRGPNSPSGASETRWTSAGVPSGRQARQADAIVRSTDRMPVARWSQSPDRPNVRRTSI